LTVPIIPLSAGGGDTPYEGGTTPPLSRKLDISPQGGDTLSPNPSPRRGE